MKGLGTDLCCAASCPESLHDNAQSSSAINSEITTSLIRETYCNIYHVYPELKMDMLSISVDYYLWCKILITIFEIYNT
jgi:hypothetical protein